MPTRHRPLPSALIAILLGLSAFFVAQLGAPAAWAQKDPRAEAKTHYLAGKKLFEQGDYEKAIAEFKAADQLAPSGVNDFNIGQAYEQLGQPAEAVQYYRSYLQRVPEAGNRASVEESIATLEATISADESRRAEDEARRLAAEEEARRIEAEQQGAPAPVQPAPTGDPELDRVAAVDVAQIRDQRQVAPIGAAAGPPPEAGAGGAGEAAAPPPPGTTGEPPKSKPIYKKWWFWVIVGVSAYVLISIVAADSNDPQPVQGRLLMPSPAPPGPSGGYTVWRF